MKKKLLIVRVDAIGDYVLFRNFIEIIAKSDRYKEYEVDMLCHTSWLELSRYLDKSYVNRFFSFDAQRYQSDTWYKISLENRLNYRHYDVVIQPTYSRVFLVDTLIHNLNAAEKIGYDGDLSNISKDNKNISDTYYTYLIRSSTEYLFEFERNKEFTEKLLKTSLQINSSFINIKEDIPIPFKNYVVLMIGASAKDKTWLIKNFVKVAQYLVSKGFKIVLCGSVQDIKNSFEFYTLYDKEYIDLVGRTSLEDILHLIKNSDLVISNDTGIAHISAALGKYTIVIFNFNHFSRFVPYPKHYEHVVTVCSFDYEDDFREYQQKYYKESHLDINLVSYESVITKVEFFIEANIKNKQIEKNCDFSEFSSLYSDSKSMLKFSQQFNIFFEKINALDEKYIIYGYGTFGKTINALIPEKVIAFVDRMSNVISKHIQKELVYSPQNLSNMQYDKILISILGREQEIIRYLIDELHIDKSKIVVLEF